MKKNEILTLQAIDYNEKGLAVCKQDSFVIFVDQLLLNEVAKVRIEKVNSSYAFGKIVEILEPSKNRVSPQCPIFKLCGGCQLQHMSYEAQLEFKKNHVENLLQRSIDSKLKVESIIGMEHPNHYRNKSIVPFNEKGDYGFFRAHSHDIVPFKSCLIQSEDADEILSFIQTFYQKNHLTFDNIRNILIKKAFKTNELMLVLVVRKKKIALKEEFIEALVKNFPSLKSIQLNINNRDDNVILGQEFEVIYGQDHITDTLDGLNFEISAASFYQVNPVQTVSLYHKAIEYANLTKDKTVLDLYCGIGTISMFAARCAKEVIGVEVIPEAIEDAKRNAELNGLTNLSFICKDAKDAFSQLDRKIDVVIVDPPRKGLSVETLNSILDLAPETLIYVSCDPGTLTRDLKGLTQTYKIEKITCVDMFPNTYHVECVASLTRKDN